MSESFNPTPFSDVNAVLGHFLGRLQAVLGERLVGMYLVGSLALGDFDPHRSDIDVVMVTSTALADDQVERLSDLHAWFDASHSPWAGRVEAVYVPRHALHPATPGVEYCPQVEPERALFMAPLESGWVFQCITLRDHPVVVAGPEPRKLVGPIPPRAIASAALEITARWMEQAAMDPTWRPWMRQQDNQAFVILTLCRLHYSLATGSVASKRRAANWARTELERRWGSLIERSLTSRHEPGSISGREEEATLDFIRFTLDRSRGR